AQSIYEDLAKKPAFKAAASVGLSRALESQGEYDKALSTVESALKEFPKDVNLLARKAEVLYLRGRRDDAATAAAAPLAIKADHFPARWVRAQVYRDKGDLKKADSEFRWFVRTYSERDDKGDPIKDAEQLVIVGLAGCENARFNRLSDQFEFVLN